MPRVSCRSRALPLATPSKRSTRTTSPSDRWPAKSASVPPICPAPMSAIFFRADIATPFLVVRALRRSRHVLHDLGPELRALDLDRVGHSLGLHEPGEVIGDAVAGDGAVHALQDQVGRLGPAHVPE